MRYVINQNMDAAPVSGAKTMLAGAFKKFKIRDVRGLRLKKLEERYAESDQVGFIGFMRSDSRVLNAGTGRFGTSRTRKQHSQPETRTPR